MPATGLNPTGQNPSTDGMMPSPGGYGNYNFGNSGNTTPTQTSANPWISPNPGYSIQNNGPFGLSGANNYSGMSKTLGDELGKIYGSGLGGLLYQYLQTGAGFNGPLTQQTIDAQLAAMQHNIALGYGNLATNMGASGISPNSSVAALETGDYFTNAVTQENAIAAQDYYNMWNQSMSNETGMIESLLSGGQSHKANSGFLGQLSSILGIAGGAANLGGAIGGGLSAAGVGAGGGAAAGIVDFLAAL